MQYEIIYKRIEFNCASIGNNEWRVCGVSTSRCTETTAILEFATRRIRLAFIGKEHIFVHAFKFVYGARKSTFLLMRSRRFCTVSSVSQIFWCASQIFRSTFLNRENGEWVMHNVKWIYPPASKVRRSFLYLWLIVHETAWFR